MCNCVYWKTKWGCVLDRSSRGLCIGWTKWRYVFTVLGRSGEVCTGQTKWRYVYWADQVGACVLDGPSGGLINFFCAVH